MLAQTLQRNIHLLQRNTSTQKLQNLLSQIFKQDCHRCLSTSSQQDLVLYQLRSRGLVQLKGLDTFSLLQGLVTNDVALLESDMNAQYSMLLNVQGRVMYDVLLYNCSSLVGEKALWMECDRGLTDKLISDIKKYKIRKKISIEDISEERAVLAAVDKVPEEVSQQDKVVVSTADPRVPAFGSRILTTAGAIDGCTVVDEETGYHERRLQWGIPEGPVDLPTGSALPLESNLVFMNGVSFSKGCYLGQELTARTHHTGVTRKRLMPLLFSKPPAGIEPGENIMNAKGKNVGKVRCIIGKVGLGLVRTAEVGGDLSVPTKAGETVSLTVQVPMWWPSEAMSCNKCL